jgi:hypothetical protein
MSYIKSAYLDLSEELGLAPAQLLEKINGEKLTNEHLDECAGCALCESDDEPVYSNADAYEDYKNEAIINLRNQ